MASILKVDKIVDSGSNVLATSSGSGHTITGTLSDSVVMTNKYYLQLTSGNYGTISNEMINVSGTTHPYFTAGTGDTTNIVAVNNHDIKLVRAGIYFISFDASFYQSGSGSNRYVLARLRHNAGSPTSSEGTDNLAAKNGQVSNTDSGDSDYGYVGINVVHNFSANHLINFYIGGLGTTSVNDFAASIFLIRPL